MKNRYSKVVLSALISCCVATTSLMAKSSEDFKLSIFHVNDTHSHISSESMKFKVNGKKTYFEVGGYARYITKLNELKSKKANSLILNAGDVFQGTLFYSLFKGEADAAAMNLIKWDAYALGNHEFDDGDEGLKSFLDRLDKSIPILAANITPKKGNILENYWKPYIVKKVNGQDIGIIGIDIVGKTKESSNPSDEILFHDEIKTAQKYIDELKSKGVNKIVLLSHVGLNNDKAYAKKLDGVDVIVGGDSHSLMGDFSALGLKSHEKAYPFKTSDKNGKNVCIVQAWEYGHILGDLDVSFDSKGDVVACEGTPYLLIGDKFKQKNDKRKKVVVEDKEKAAIMKIVDSTKNVIVVKEDKSTLDVIKTFEDQVGAKKSIMIGKAGEKLGHNRIPGDKKDGSSVLPLGSDIAPIVSKSFYDLSNLADACIQNAGGVRAAVSGGDITMGTAYSLLPFSNTLFEIKMTANEIKQVLEDALAFATNPNGSTGAFPYSYALKYDVDLTAEVNNRVSNLELKDRKSGKWNKLELNSDRLYTIVTNSYIAGGKDGYKTFKTVQELRGKGTDTFLDYAMSFVRYVENKTKNGQKVTKLPLEDHPIKSFKK